jgi:hypothetical protein
MRKTSTTSVLRRNPISQARPKRVLLLGDKENPTLDTSAIARVWGKHELVSADFSLKAH